ncbi:MAG: HAD family phosphatase [Lachnospiraceae bacterium]|nr:HAD family phosphatase [Lachnospiraceae bacterium]
MIDTEPLYSRFWREAAAEYSYAMTYEDSLSLRSLDNSLARERFKELLDRDVYDMMRERRKALMERYRKDHPIQAKPGAKELMKELEERQLPYYIVTASPADRAERYMTEAGLHYDADRFISTKTVQRGKPWPDVYLEALRISGARAYETIAVEDSPNGIKSAAAAGLKAVMVPDLTEPGEEERRLCYRVCGNVLEVLKLI